jgi:hypothetical protein
VVSVHVDGKKNPIVPILHFWLHKDENVSIRTRYIGDGRERT